MMIASNMWQLECYQCFLLIWPGDLVFHPKWPSFKLDLEIIKTNMLSKIHDDCLKNATTRVLTRFSADFARWPSFWPQVTQFQTWPRNHQDKHFEQDSSWLLKKCDCSSVNKVIKTNNLSKIHDDCFKHVTARVLTKFSADLARWCSFWSQVT